MNRVIAFPALLFSAVLMVGDNATPAAVYLQGDKVAEALAKGGMLVALSDVSVQGGHRTGPGQVELHQKETDVLYIIDGEATFVTGGTMIGGKQVRPGQYLGTNIQGGQTYHLKKGDVMVIPAGIPHWFKDLNPPVNYFVVKSLR